MRIRSVWVLSSDVLVLWTLFGLTMLFPSFERSSVHCLAAAFQMSPIQSSPFPAIQSLSTSQKRTRTTCFSTSSPASGTRSSASSSESPNYNKNDDSTLDVFDADKMEAQQRKLDAQRKKRLEQSPLLKDDQEWKFFDTARIHVTGGPGGNGCVAFRRERGEPRGGPNGGRGGAGGNVILVCDGGLNTLAPLRQQIHVRGQKGANGTGKNRDGCRGKDIIVAVPPGTLVRELHTQKLAGELRAPGETLVVARGGRGGRGNAAFMTHRNTAPKLAERGEPGAARWLSLELRLVADVGFLGQPNAGKSTLLAAASAARPKIANYPFTTLIPNLGVCDLNNSDGTGLVLCDIPGLIEGASKGAGLGPAFLRHVQRCKVLLHVVDGTAADPIRDFVTINKELEQYDEFLSKKPQVVVLNKIDVPEVRDMADEMIAELKRVAGHSRVLAISAATTERVKELMQRLSKFVESQPVVEDLPPPPEVDLAVAALDYDSDDFTIESDPAYPGQFRLSGHYIEQIAKMTHWEYPEAVERFGRQLQALGIADALKARGAEEGDLVMVGDYDFEFSPATTNVYIPEALLEQDALLFGDDNGTAKKKDGDEYGDEDLPWRPYAQGGFLDVDTQELAGFSDTEDWDALDQHDERRSYSEGPDGEYEDGEFFDFEDFDMDEFMEGEEEVWTSQ